MQLKVLYLPCDLTGTQNFVKPACFSHLTDINRRLKCVSFFCLTTVMLHIFCALVLQSFQGHSQICSAKTTRLYKFISMFYFLP